MKVLDITDKLKTQEQPVLKVKDCEFAIADDAVTLLTVMELMDGDVNMLEVKAAAIQIFGEEGFKKLSEMKLNIDNFMTVIQAAMDLVIGNSEGEQARPGTTSSMTGI